MLFNNVLDGIATAWTSGKRRDPSTCINSMFFWKPGGPLLELTYTNWEEGEPNCDGGHEGCLEIKADGTWNDIECEASRPTMCQIDIN